MHWLREESVRVPKPTEHEKIEVTYDCDRALVAKSGYFL